LPPRHLDGVLDRLGLRGRRPCTLADAGRVAGVSGERVRQIEAKVHAGRARSGHTTTLPQLDQALAVVERALPVRADEVGELLRAAGASAGPFCAESLEAAASLLGRALPFVTSGHGSDAVLLPRVAADAAAHARRIENRARRLVERSGATTLDDLERDLVHEGLAIPRRHLLVVLQGCGTAVVREDGWFWFRHTRNDGPFARATRRMLAVNDPLPLASLHEGLRRHNAFRRIPVLPPPSVLAAVYATDPTVRIEGGTVRAVEPVPADAMGDLNRRIVDILRAAPHHVLARCDLLEACHEAGLNLASVNLYTSYSECLERMGSGVLAPRGTVVDEEAVRARQRRREPWRRDEDRPAWGWTPDGRPWVQASITTSTWANGVLHVPAEVRPVLAGRRFATRDQAGACPTMLGVDRHGNSWGWTGFLRRCGGRPGDVVRAEFDLSAGIVGLALTRLAAPAAAAG
ncbi:MAG: hypothetical protein M3Q48_04890, partial [Actinomycetota bacterium]|nr:hypothetical protein [Actinomycetota bacterium]